MNILWFKNIKEEDTAFIGKKAAVISELYNSRFNIPHGFIITSTLFKDFIRDSRIEEQIKNILENSTPENLEELSKEIQQLFFLYDLPEDMKKEISKSYEGLSLSSDLLIASDSALNFIRAGRELPFVSIRPSSLSELDYSKDSFLNIKGSENILKAIQKCYASLFSKESLKILLNKNLQPRNLAVSLVIQKMADSDKSGIVYPEEDKLRVISGYGLGDVISSRSVDVDEFTLSKENLKIIDKKIGNKTWMSYKDFNTGRTIKRELSPERANSQSISEDEIIKVTTLAKRIEKYYGIPKEIEFSIEGSKIFLINVKDPQENKEIEEDLEPEETNENINPKEKLIDLLKNSEVIYKTDNNTYIDLKKSYGDPKILNLISDLLLEKIPEDTTCLAASGYGGTSLATLLASKRNLKLTFVREKPKIHGKGGWLDGHIPSQDDKVVILDDIYTKEKNTSEVLNLIRTTGTEVLKHLVVIKKDSSDLTIPLDSLLESEDLIDNVTT